ncbi:hypothetical protein [uncultured Nostoc sp.]|uniref:hypothetical protein n=1 Tax=uncultured Nostoc sp. TaxID=340711 RepID=UPI0035C96795
MKFREIGNRKATTSTDKFKYVGVGVASRRDALPKASPFSCPIRFFSNLIFLLETLVNQRLLGNEIAMLFKGVAAGGGSLLQHYTSL